MSMIRVNHLTFGYEGSYQTVFEDISFHIDTDWKLGLIGRNGKGKTTLLRLLQGAYEYTGTITKNVEVDYFPFEIAHKEKMAIEIISEIAPTIEEWEIVKEINLLHSSSEILYRSFHSLSGGEQVKILLVSLFLKGNNFLLIDEPTNHLDRETRQHLVTYLKKKKGFILVSHDRNFLDQVVDHIIAMNRTNIEIQQGNYSAWKENKDRIDHYEEMQNQKLQKDITRLEFSAMKMAKWSNETEKGKSRKNNSEAFIDKGYIGHKSAKMMKHAKVMEQRIDRAIEEKTSLLKNIDRNDQLKIIPLINTRNPMVIANHLQIKYDNKRIFSPISFEVHQGDRIAIVGKNGAGKTSILKLILKERISYEGDFSTINGLKISYVSQSTDDLMGDLSSYAQKTQVEESILKAMLSKMGFSQDDFDTKLQEMSEGQKKKVLIAKSISQQANLYLWDEPLNYIDILTREQIEAAILTYQPTLLFVEHDDRFIEKIATKTIYLK